MMDTHRPRHSAGRVQLSRSISIWGIVAAASVCLAVWLSLPGKLRAGTPKATDLGSNSPTQFSRADKLAMCDAVPTVPVSAETAAALRDHINAAIRDPHAVLTGTIRTSLVETLTRHLVARSAATPVEYLRLIGEEQTRWIGETDERMWRIIIARYSAITNRNPKRNDPREALTTIMSHSLGEDGCRIVAVGTGTHGAVVIAAKARNPEILDNHLMTTPDELGYWSFTTSTGSAIAFRTPVTSFEDVVARDKSGLFVEAAFLLQLQKDRRVLINTKWFWDPRLGVWQCARFQDKGPFIYYCEF